MKSGRDHVGEHAGIYRVDVVRKLCKVSVRIVHVEELGENTVFKVGELPARQHTAGVHGIARLCLQRVPVRGDCRNQNTVARLKVLDEGTDLDHFRATLVTEDHVVTVADRTFPKRVNVRSTNRDCQGAADGIHRTTLRTLLFNPAGLSDFEHCVTLHSIPPSKLCLFFNCMPVAYSG